MIAGLIPIQFHLWKLADRSSFYLNILSASHPLRTILGPSRLMGAEPYACSIYHMTEAIQAKVKSTLMEINSQMMDVGKIFDPLCPELAPSRQFMDLLSEWVKFNNNPRNMKPVDFVDTLDEAIDQAHQLTDCICIFTDTFTTKWGNLQAASAAFISRRGTDLIKVRRPAGKATAPDTKLFAICLGISWAV
jgi:hypothetical protein